MGLRRAPGARGRARRGVFALLFLCVVCGVGVYAVHLRGADPATVTGGGSSGSYGAALGRRGRFLPPFERFLITGSLAGLYPGAEIPLDLTVHNPFGSAITVTSLAVTVADASRGCRAANLKVTSFAGALRVPAQHSSKLTVEATLQFAAPDACEGAIFPLVYSGSAKVS